MSMPDVQFAELDPRKVEAAVIAGYESAARQAGQSDFKLYPGDPRRLFLEAVAAMIAQQNNVIDLTGKGNLLRYAGEDTIEDLGWLYGTRGDRLGSSRASTRMEFTLSNTRPTTTIIPMGTRISAGGGLMFATALPLEIPVGQLTGTVTAECEVAGTAGNGLLPGQISNLVDRNPFVVSAVNVTESSGGAGMEELEAYRQRIRSAPESFSVAGPDGAYEFWAKSANPGIIDVGVWSPTPGEVNLAPLMTGGNLPTQGVLDEVYAICSDRTVRPLTDYVRVLSPTPISYDLHVAYWIDRADATSATVLSNAIEASVAEYVAWQCARLGRDIIPSELTRCMMEAGARRVRVESPVYTVLDKMEVARIQGREIVYGGLEDA